MSLRTVISVSFVFLTIYACTILLDWTYGALLLMALSPILVIWVAYKTLIDPYQSTTSFNERFYEDYEYQRNQ